jgi:hypothetical protein
MIDTRNALSAGVVATVLLPDSSLQQASNDADDAVAINGPKLRYAKLGKDPTVRTDFLPDKDRQREEDEMREKLKVGRVVNGVEGVLEREGGRQLRMNCGEVKVLCASDCGEFTLCVVHHL